MNKYRRNWKSNKKPEHIGDILGKYLEASGISAAMTNMSVVQRWPEIVGDRVAAVTECYDLNEGILKVKVISAPWRQELCFMKGDLIKAIIREVGSGLVKDISFS